MKNKFTAELPMHILEAAETLSPEEFNAKNYQIEAKQVVKLTVRIVDDEVRLYFLTKK